MAAQESEFASEFDWAVVRLATYFPASALQARLLFGSVSLLTRDRPRPPTSRGAEHHKIGKGKSGKIFFRRTVLSVRDAITWYRSAGTGNVTTPVPTEPSEVEKKMDGIALTPTSFEDDPQWPSLGVPLDIDPFPNVGPGDPAPFRGPGAPRIHRRFGDNTGFEDVLADRSAIAFLRRRLHLDLSDYTEYLGGLTLVVPDPVLRHVQHFLVPPQDGSGTERLIYRLVPRPGHSLDKLKFTVLEQRSNLLSRLETFEVTDNGLVDVASALPFDQTGYAISDPVQGVIAYQQPLPFLRSMTVSVGVAGRRIKVETPQTESPSSATDTYEVTEYAQEIPISIGELQQGAVIMVARAQQRRIRRAAAQLYKQTWFDSGQRIKAMSFIREQLASARTSVMVADPYFGALQIFQFLHAVPRTHIDFTILTSRLAFESDHAEVNAPSRGQAQNAAHMAKKSERLTRFTDSLAKLRARGMKSVTTLVLSGKSPPLHDRFLVIDGEVLFLGNSLNVLGDRASLILSVPDSDSILAKLHEMERLAVPFEAYASQRLPPASRSGGS